MNSIYQVFPAPVPVESAVPYYFMIAA
jgi:hypothetical protein